jgi:catechol 2,3-dioxygenase-like lactoylglutathione lyase family enzyme
MPQIRLTRGPGTLPGGLLSGLGPRRLLAGHPGTSSYPLDFRQLASAPREGSVPAPSPAPAGLPGSARRKFSRVARRVAAGQCGTGPLGGGCLLAGGRGLGGRANLAKDASLPAGPPSSTEFSLGIPAGSQAEVDRLLGQAQAAGGTLTAPAHMRPFGVYSGYFTDPDGHLFEIAWDSNE